MKHPMLAAIITSGLACVAGASAAQDQTQATTLQNLTVTGEPAPYETYVVEFHTGYGLQALVGNTRSQYVQAQRAAEASEALRMQGMAFKPYVAVAIDNSSGPGVARQVQVIDAAQSTVAIVNVYCKRSVPSGSSHCRLVSLPVSNNAYRQGLASR